MANEIITTYCAACGHSRKRNESGVWVHEFNGQEECPDVYEMLAYEQVEIERLRDALSRCRISIIENAPDTIWLESTPGETVCGFINSILGEDNCDALRDGAGGEVDG